VAEKPSVPFRFRRVESMISKLVAAFAAVAPAIRVTARAAAPHIVFKSSLP
jgi:hypothetical protein